MSTKLYLSAAFPRHREVNAIAHELRRDGITIVSTWHAHPTVESDNDLTNAQREDAALMDLADLEDANVLCMLGDPKGEYAGSGGKFVEFGYALSLGMHVVVVSHRSSVFEYVPGVIFAPDIEAAKSYLRSLRVNSSGKVAA